MFTLNYSIKTKAFSLVELLVSLIIVSLLLGAFAPVVTKKLKASDVTVGSFSTTLKSTDDCEKFSVGDNKCIMCSSSACTMCTSQFNGIAGYYVDPLETCEPKKCSDKFGSNCIDCNKNECKTCAIGTTLNENKSSCEIVYCSKNEYLEGSACKACPNGTYQSDTKHQKTSCSPCPSECTSCTSNETCTSCAPNYTLIEGKCVLGCNPKTITIGATKVTQYNMGDDPNCPRNAIEAMSGVTFVPVGTTCDGELCCWYGVTANTDCTNVGGLYSGCNRTVCKWWAAKKICESIGEGWKLPPTSASMENWYPNNSTASTGLMLCDHSRSSSAASQCTHVTNCPGSLENGLCCPYHIWAESGDNNSAQTRKLIASGIWRTDTNGKTYAFSVRCIKE